MSLSIVMLVKDRPRLTRQALESLVRNTRGHHNIVIVDDGSAGETQSICIWFAQTYHWDYIKNVVALGPGTARNQGIRSHAQRGNRGLIYSADNDGFFMPGWDQILVGTFLEAEKKKFKVLAGYCHPYNQTIQLSSTAAGVVHEKHAVGLLSTLMRWETYDQYGPYEPSTTTNGSEDFAFCQKVRADGFRVGSVWPWVILNCGLTGTNGKFSPGPELIYEQNFPPGVIVE